MFFRILNERKLGKKQEANHHGSIEKIINLNKVIAHGGSPPPPYAEIFSRHTSGVNLFGADTKSGVGSHKIINGRDYVIVGSQLIPIRAPSAAIFQYTYTN